MNVIDFVLMTLVVIVGVLVGLVAIVVLVALLVGVFAKGYDASREKDDGRAEALLIARWYQDHQRVACAVSAGKEKPASTLFAQLGG